MSANPAPMIERIPADFLHQPFELFARMRAGAPACQVVMPHGVKVWLVTRYDEVRALLMDPRISKDGRRMNEMSARHSEVSIEDDSVEGGGFDDDLSAHLANTDPPIHTRLRTLVGKAFTAPRMESLRPRLEQVVDELLDAMAGQDQVDLISALAMPLPVTIVFDLLGIPHSDRGAFRQWATALVGTGHAPEAVAEASRQVTAYANDLIDAKREHPDDALVSALVRVTDDDGDRLTQRELVAMIFILVVAGSEAPMHQLGNAVYSLLTHPAELARLRADLSAVPDAVEELMRFDGAVGTSSFRFTAADIPVGEVVIPAGEIVVLSLSSANRDGAHFPDPDILDLDRRPTGVLGFGHGIHYCIGAPLAKVTLQVGLSKLLARFPHLRLAVAPEQLRWQTSNLMRGLTALPVRLR